MPGSKRRGVGDDVDREAVGDGFGHAHLRGDRLHLLPGIVDVLDDFALTRPELRGEVGEQGMVEGRPMLGVLLATMSDAEVAGLM